ncbi:H(+)/Cl(-) exchange transporter ClcA [mine drainage metagenome]|uniref:H(+)/Cl(-) exchange transporter ClcA n=1 Tax=mine drainage metagenome TaxID=410659 RepID=A0A1J5SAB2_9ZZZZ
MSVLGGLLGMAAAVIAWLLYRLIGLITNLVFFLHWGYGQRVITTGHVGWLVVLIPAAGGAVVGLMARYGSSQIRGHGIPEAMEAVLFKQSRIEPRVAVLKPISAAIAIGTGGPFGAEGPIIQTGGAAGSVLGQWLGLSSNERKTLLAAGAGAGMAATFSTPLAGVILAIELLLFEYKPRSFIPLVIATTLATTVRFLLLGPGAMFTVGHPDFGVHHALLVYPWYVLLGVCSGLAAVAFSKALYWTEDQYAKLPVSPFWWPAIGGLGLGLIGLFVPRVLGVGYESISQILNDRLALTVLLLVVIAKPLALLISLGSGTSGGLLAPMFMTGAGFGCLFAHVVNHFVPASALSPSACALVAMAAFFGAAARAPFTLIVFVFEITRNYESVLPLMLVVAVAEVVTLLLMGRSTIMTEKLIRRGRLVNQDYEADVFQRITVGQVMERDPVTLPADMTVHELSSRIAGCEPAVARSSAYLLADPEGRLAGLITRGDVLKSLERDPSGSSTLAEAGTAHPEVARPDELVSEALDRMLDRDCGRLPVVAPEDPGRIIGYLGRSAVLRARLHAR